MRFIKKKRGFTLVELVVVIAILAILAGTATVATIAVLNNARKTPVTDTVSSLKTQLGYYNAMDDYKEDKDGFKAFLKGSMPDLVVDDNTGTNVTSCSDDSIHIILSTSSKLKSQEWSIIVYTKYYKQRITCKYDNDAKAITTYELSEIVKIDEDIK